MDRNPKAEDDDADKPSPANSEASGDSEVDSAASPPAYDNDDAESSSAGEGDEEAAGGGGRDRGHHQAAEKWPCIMSWRGWLQACASAEHAAETDRYPQQQQQQQQQEQEGGEASSGAAAADAESNRLFWEACLAHGYP